MQADWTNPPKAIGPLNDHNAMADMFPQPYRVTNFDGQLVDPFYTYGIWLCNPTAREMPIDENIMGILVRCLAADPADRPSLRELIRWARWRQAQPDWKEGQDEIRAWANEHIRQAPIVRKGLRISPNYESVIKLTPCALRKPSPQAPSSLRTGLAAIGTDVMDRLTRAAELLRIGGVANMADKAEKTPSRSLEPVKNLRQRYQEQEGTGPAQPPATQQAPAGWWDTMVYSRLAQLQNLLNIGRLPSTADEPPPRPVRRRGGIDDLRARFHEDAEGQPQPPQPPQNVAPSGPVDDLEALIYDLPAQPRGILRRSRPVRDLRVRFADDAGPSSQSRGLRRRPRFNDLRGRYQADVDDDLAL